VNPDKNGMVAHRGVPADDARTWAPTTTRCTHSARYT
jgi:hypothetical protein